MSKTQKFTGIVAEKMNPAVKERWLEALRSGEYVQGREMLRGTNDTYCCLGVLCDLYSKDFNVEWVPEHDADFYNFKDQMGVPPDEVYEWSGLNNYFGADGYAGKVSFDYLNDCLDFDFQEIADLIEEHF